MSLTKPQLDALTDLLRESLRARAGHALDDLVIEDRARNAAQLLSVTYEMRPLTEAAVVSARYFTCRCRGAKHGALTGCSGTGTPLLCAYCIAECRGSSCGEAP